jgi:hypothetical protein
MGPPALLPIREEGVLRIFIAIKNPSAWPSSNPRPLGPVASTLTTTPPRRPILRYLYYFGIYLDGLRRNEKELSRDSRRFEPESS